VNRIKDVLPFVYRQNVAGEGADEDLVRSYWSSAVGEEIARRAKPVRLRGGTLEIEVDDASWLRTLRGLREQIIRRVNAAVDQQAVQKIRFHDAELTPRPPGRAEIADDLGRPVGRHEGATSSSQGGPRA
jgi:predicted nucleic acid-binding Zn ribbon protein